MIKKIVSLGIILLLSLYGIFLLCYNSNNFNIDMSALHLSTRFTGFVEGIPQKQNDSLILTAVDHNSLPFTFNGEYSRKDLSEIIKKKIEKNRLPTANVSYMWVKNNKDIEKESVVCFLEDHRLIVLLEDQENIMSFKCYFKNDKIEISNIDNFGVYEYKLLNSMSETNVITSETIEDILINENEKSELELDLLSKLLIEWWFEGVLSLIFAAILFMIISMHTSYLLYKKYKNDLREEIFPEEHMWFDENTPKNIYVAARVFSKGDVVEYNLIDYFSEEFIGDIKRNYAIIGNAGEGKTFSVSRLALAILDCFSFDKRSNKEQHKKIKKLVPVILNFSELSVCKDGEELVTAIYDKICSVTKIKRKPFLEKFRDKRINSIKRFLSAGRFVIFADGYDEIVDEGIRLKFSKLLIDFMQEYSNCCYIITSRNQVYEHEVFLNISTEQTLYLSPLSREQIREFISKWNFDRNKSGSELYQRIVNSIQVESMVTNPLLLTMVTHAYNKTDFDFTNSKVRLYEQCCNCLLKKWERKKSIIKRIKRYATVEDVRLKIELLSTIAYYMFEHKVPFISEREVIELWSKHKSEPIHFAGKAKYVFREIMAQSGLLEMMDENKIRFKHRSFYEYLVALYLLEKNYDFKTLYKNVPDEKNIIFFYLSMVENEGIVIDFIVSTNMDKKLAMDLLIERQINNTSEILVNIKHILEHIDYSEIAHLQSIGYIARKYMGFRDVIKTELMTHLSKKDSEKVRVNIIIGLMLFCTKKEIQNVLKGYINEINLDSIVQYSGDILNELSLSILALIDSDSKKYKFIELLSKTYRLEAIYNIYKNGNKEANKFAILGLLYMTKEQEVFDYLRIKSFEKTIDKKILDNANTLLKKYGWTQIKEKDYIKSIFLLVYMGKELVKTGIVLNSNLINNRIVFIISYIVSIESGKIYSNMLEKEGFRIECIIELSYHWKRSKRGKYNFFSLAGTFFNIKVINTTILFLLGSLLFIQAFVYVSTTIDISELSLRGWEVKNTIKNEILSSYSNLSFNSVYFIFTAILFMAYDIINIVIRAKKYTANTVILSIIASLIISSIYITYVQNIIYRLTTVTFMLFISFFEILKHRNNYPSFKEPQYSRIVNYLSEDEII